MPELADLIACAASSTSVARRSIGLAHRLAAKGIDTPEIASQLQYARDHLAEAITTLDQVLNPTERSSP